MTSQLTSMQSLLQLIQIIQVNQGGGNLAAGNLGNLAINLRTFLARDFHMKSGMKHLIESFYRSVVEGAPAPIPYREILLTARIMDAIFAQLEVKRSGVQAHDQMPLHATVSN